MRSMRPAPTHAHATPSFFHPSIHACIFVCVRFRHGLSPPLPCATSISFRSTRPTVCLNFSERGIYTAAKPEGKGFFLGLGGGGCARCAAASSTRSGTSRSSFETLWDMRYVSGWLWWWFVWKNWRGRKFVKLRLRDVIRARDEICRQKFAGEERLFPRFVT